MRLFLALDPGEACRQRLAGVVAAVRASATGVRWVREGQLHVTLAFFGEVAEARVEELSASMREVVARHAPFSVLVSGSGVFPDWRRTRVVWLGLGDGETMAALGAEVGRTSTVLGLPPLHPFRAHLTIGRVTRPLRATDRDALRAALDSLSESYPFDVSRVILMRSEIGPTGSRYSEVASYPLGGA